MGDLDGDGSPDLAVALSTRHLVQLMNDGSGGFGPPVVHELALNYSGGFADAVMLDVENDGDLDVAYSNTGSYGQPFHTDPGILLFHNDGTGALTAPTFVRYQLPPENVVLDLHAVDLDGDGFTDIVGAHRYEFGILTMLNDGSGGFLQANMVAGGTSAEALAVGDANADGAPDILTVTREHRLLSVHLNEGSGSFPELPLQGNSFSHGAIDMGDADNDGDLDLVTSHTGSVSSDVIVYLNDGAARYVQSYATPSLDYGHAIFADLNGDTVLDLLFTSGADEPPYDFFTALGIGDGTYQPVVRWTINTCGSRFPGAFDIDNDGDLDVLVGEDRSCPNGSSSGRRIFIRLNNGDATFAPPYVIETGNFPLNLAAADFNHDGNLDLVTAAFGFPSLHLGNGDGTFEPFEPLPAGQVGYNLITGDFDADGNPDIAAHDEDERDEAFLSVLLGDGTGQFTETEYEAPTTQRFQQSWVRSGDVDGDGDLDLIETGEQDAIVHLNDGAGHFSVDHRRYGLAKTSLGLVYGDATGDGIADLVSTASLQTPPSGLGRGVVVLPGLVGGGSPPPSGPIVLLSPSGGETVQAGTSQTISWDPGGVAPGTTLSLNLRRTGRDNERLATSIPNSGSFAWDVSSFQETSDEYRLTLVYNDPLSGDRTRLKSGFFEIVGGVAPPAPIAISSPTAGTIWTPGETVTVEWDPGDVEPATEVTLKLKPPGTGTVRIAASTPNTGLYEWVVPSHLASGNGYRVVLQYSDGEGNRQKPKSDEFEVAASAELAVKASTPFELGAPVPNPARDQVVLPFALERGGAVRLSVFDARGREVARLADETLQPGAYQVVWKLDHLAPGVYLIRLVAGEGLRTRRVVIVP